MEAVIEHTACLGFCRWMNQPCLAAKSVRDLVGAGHRGSIPSAYHQLRWNVVFCGTPEDLMRQKQGQMPDKFTAKSKADVFVTEEENLAFQGGCVCVRALGCGGPVSQDCCC
eukprot:855135-Pelagomonas_calceolata.AAC.5